MKTERRHELQTNQLADWMGSSVETAKPYTKLAIGVLVAVVVILGSVYYLSGQTAKRQAEGWEKYFAGLTRPTPDQLQSVADAYRGTAVGNWSRVELADVQAVRGTEALFKDRAEANEELRAAQQNYAIVADDPAAGDIPRQRALLGLARVSESLNELDRAREAYQRLLTEFPNCAFADEANFRLTDLNRPATKAFYDWFASQDPQPAQEDLNPLFEGIQGLGQGGTGSESGGISIDELDIDLSEPADAGDMPESAPADEAPDATEGATEGEAAPATPESSDAPEDATDAAAPQESTPAAQP